MYPEQQTLRDEVIRQWQPYGLVAAYWADQLVSAMMELDRVQSLNAAQAAAIADEAHSCLGMSNSDYSAEKRMQRPPPRSTKPLARGPTRPTCRYRNCISCRWSPLA